ncbi:MAG: hypothetical protein RHS_4031 [Robinsoniella sp. RHS]|nr:MAG: hypothetical protein RHS_4031 [Robinsoniella sp. RHS]
MVMAHSDPKAARADGETPLLQTKKYAIRQPDSILMYKI